MKTRVVRLHGGNAEIPSRFWPRTLATLEELPEFLEKNWIPSDDSKLDGQFGPGIKNLEIISITDPLVVKSLAHQVVELQSRLSTATAQLDQWKSDCCNLASDLPKGLLKKLRPTWTLVKG